MLLVFTCLVLLAFTVALTPADALADETPVHDCLEGATMDMPGDGDSPATPQS